MADDKVISLIQCLKASETSRGSHLVSLSHNCRYKIHIRLMMDMGSVPVSHLSWVMTKRQCTCLLGRNSAEVTVGAMEIFHWHSPDQGEEKRGIHSGPYKQGTRIRA